MSVITGYNKNKFISAEEVYSKVRRDLRSFTNSNLIDDGDFPVYTAEILNLLGISTMREAEAILEVTDGKAELPVDFVELYAAYKCTPFSKSERWIPQGPVQVKQDVTCEILGVRNENCAIDCNYDDRVLKKVTTQMYINDSNYLLDYINPILLRLSPNVKSKCTEDCMNLISTAPYEMTIDGNYIRVNFDNENIYLKYYAFPLDHNGLPMIPDNQFVIKAVEKYIKYQLLLNWWYNGDVADISNKWQKAEQEYNQAFAEAKFQLKLPAFSTLVDTVRNRRAQNMVTFFSRQYSR